jgi:hypothetical protein
LAKNKPQIINTVQINMVVAFVKLETCSDIKMLWP